MWRLQRITEKYGSRLVKHAEIVEAAIYIRWTYGEHDAQFSVSTRLTGYSRYGGAFNYLGEGNFFGQIGEKRISNIRRYGQ